MAATVTTLVQTTEVDNVGVVVITDIIQDPDSLQWIREIRVYSSADVADFPPVFTLRLTSPVQTQIELTAPAAQF